MESKMHLLPKELLEVIFKFLNVRDIAQVRRVCHIWNDVATPLFLSKIDEIEVNFCVTDKKEEAYQRALINKYREKQRGSPNQKLCRKDIQDIYNEITAEIYPNGKILKENLDDIDNRSLITKYCDYIESGGTIRYINFNFFGIKLTGSDVVRRFFVLCGQDVTALTISISHADDYRYCDQHVILCKDCLPPNIQETTYVVNRSRLKAYVLNYCPNLNILTLHHDSSHDPPKSNQPKDDEESDLDDEDIDHEFVDEMCYFMRFGDIQNPQSDKRWVTVKDEPPNTNIHTIHIMDAVVAYLSKSMFIYDLFALCPKLIRASQFGMEESAFQSHTFDFVRCLVSNELMNTITDIFLRHLDSIIIGMLLRRHKHRLRLKFLKVNYLVTHLVEQDLLQFLESQSSNLETIMCGLTQKKIPSWSHEEIRFPKEMPKLTHLRIGLGTQKQQVFSPQPPKEFAPIDWSKQFPALKTLMLPEIATNVTIASFFQYASALEPLTTVTGLELPAGLVANLMKRAGFLFPNVTQLAVGYQTVVSLRQIWTMWPKLESLHISVVNYKEDLDIDSLDELLTGFDKEQMKMAKSGNLYVVGTPMFPSITNLKCLRELTIFGAPYRTHSSGLHRMNLYKNENDYVTDVTLIHALMKLPSLKYLDISDHLHQISPAVDKKFCDCMHLIHEDNVNYRDNFTVMSHYRGREEAHPMCREDSAYKDK